MKQAKPVATPLAAPSGRIIAAVWVLRILVGATFIISGAAKMIDPYGFFYKIEQYFAVWQWDMPQSLTFFVATAISMSEFIGGFTLATGSFKRVSCLGLLTMMAFMLPLTGYIAVADPVDDCGCFGDLLILSNSVTFIKNILITAALIWLLRHTSHVSGLFRESVQWLQVTVACLYMGLIGIVGYHEQPMLDFRPYPIGTDLAISVDNDSDASDNMLFIYEKNGVRSEFTVDQLPDSSWTFVERIEPQSTDSQPASFIISDEYGDDVTDDVITADGEQLLLLIPDMSNYDISNSYTVNELNSYITRRGGSMIAIINGTPAERDEWIDVSMADYPVYFSEDTAIKTLARGRLAMVYLVDGVIRWKRTVSSINLDKLDSSALERPLEALTPSGGFWRITTWFVISELIIAVIGAGFHLVHTASRKKASAVAPDKPHNDNADK